MLTAPYRYRMQRRRIMRAFYAILAITAATLVGPVLVAYVVAAATAPIMGA